MKFSDHHRVLANQLSHEIFVHLHFSTSGSSPGDVTTIGVN